jgi:homoserine dehydrogenase
MIIASASPSSSRSLMARRRQTCQRSARIALLGCGAVGAAIARALLESRRRLEQSAGVGLSLARILVRDLTRPRQFDRQHFTTDIREVLSSPTW